MTRRANYVLNFFLAGLTLIFLRAWICTSTQRESYLKESLKPMRRTVTLRGQRGTIRDRFNVPLAINQIQYDVAILYADIRAIPRVTWEEDEQGKRKKCLKRRDYIEKLSTRLASALDMDAADIEDRIYGKACLFPHTPLVLKEGIEESLFFQLKMAQKDWPGIDLQQTTRRVYPQGKVACDVVGYVGAISTSQYKAVYDEIQTLKRYLARHRASEPTPLPKGFFSPEEVERRLDLLETRAYTINDQVGKMGIEAAYDKQLRGQAGRSVYEVDIRGNLLTKLPESTPPCNGERVILSLSVELQKEAERLLTQYEGLQDKRDAKEPRHRHHPWQRGGAIVALDPRTGEVLALASYPRFDPNDLVPAKTKEQRKKQQGAITKWLESLSYIGEIWDGKRPMERELYEAGDYFTDTLPLTWGGYLDTILSKESAIYTCLKEIETLGQAADRSFTLPIARDQNLAHDLLEMVAPKALFPPSLLAQVSNLPLADHRTFCQTFACHLDPLKERVRELFHMKDFRQWREKHATAFLKKKRKLERALGRYARPYIDYLQREESEQFARFWQENRLILFKDYLLEERTCPYATEMMELRRTRGSVALDELKEWVSGLSAPNQLAYLKTLRTFEELDKPLSRSYPALRNERKRQLQKHLATAFYPYCGFGYGRSQAFRQASPQGSIFKILTAYSGIKQQYERGADSLNPLTLIDDMQWTAKPGSNSQILGRFTDGRVIRRLYKGGRLPRAYPNIGQIDVTSALERTSNLYFSILAGDILDRPSRLLCDAIDFGLGNRTGIELPGEFSGILPDDITHNKTGLYSFAMGQHSLVVTPLQTALMLSALANGGKLFKPQVVKCTATADGVSLQEPTLRDDLNIPPPVQTLLLEGLFKVTSGAKGTARPQLIRTAFHPPEAVLAYRELHTQIAGKTGTAEILFKKTIDAESPAKLEKHSWFGAIGYRNERPDIVVVVYNRFASAGKQGGPIAAYLIKRWREIQQSHYNADS